ncbi:MAG: tyrosine-type recombinase/integrase [Dehalococcoidia bacterium]|nr:tyrosine-type recombinase/integrase [Dehalococcoidia bacterium]
MVATGQRWTAMKKDHLPLAQLITSYDLFNRAAGKSPTTVTWYQSRLGMFLRYLGEDSDLAALSVDAVRGYIVYLQGRNDRHAGSPHITNPQGKLSSAYIHGCVRPLRSFASWLHAEGYTDTNRLQAVKPPKVQKKVTQVLTDDEVQRLLSCFDRREFFGARNHAMVYTLLDTGLRASELVNLTLNDAHLKEGFLQVLGKGNKERLVPFGTGAQAALLRWRDEVRPHFGGEGDGLFLDAGGGQMSVNALQEVVQRAARRAAIPRATCHLLRHTFATNYLVREVGDPLRLQQILGHTTLEMVRHYVALANVQQSLIDRRASPMDLILNKERSTKSRLVQPRRAAKLRLVR